MRIATRTGLATGAATALAVIIVAIGVSVLLRTSASARVDDELRERSAAAPVFAAVGARVAASELNPTIGGVRVATDGEVFGVGRLPGDPLPPLEEPGWRTVRSDDEDWRLYAVEVTDVPLVGDGALVEFVEPLGDVDEQVQSLRRRTIFLALITGLVVASLGWWWGRRATRPLTSLADDANRIGTGSADGRPASWAVRTDSGSPEVDDVARALNRSLEQLARQTERTEEALDSARAFGASASHELRTPLQSALTNLDVANAAGRGGPEVDAARQEVQRAAARLSAVRALSAIGLVGDEDLAAVDIAEIVDRVVGTHSGRFAAVAVEGPESLVVQVWPEGVRLAVDNVVRNALTHARPAGEPVRLVVTIGDDGTVIVDDDGVGIDPADRERLLGRYERGGSGAAGTGLGLTLAARVVEAHGGSLTLDRSPQGGLRVALRFADRR